jgi:hypothetical protein
MSGATATHAVVAEKIFFWFLPNNKEPLSTPLFIGGAVLFLKCPGYLLGFG